MGKQKWKEVFFTVLITMIHDKGIRALVQPPAGTGP